MTHKKRRKYEFQGFVDFSRSNADEIYDFFWKLNQDSYCRNDKIKVTWFGEESYLDDILKNLKMKDFFHWFKAERDSIEFEFSGVKFY